MKKEEEAQCSLIYDKLGNIKDIVEISYKSLNNYCYFCDFHEAKPHHHHIIRKTDGGDNSNNNILPLCPNHHYLIHARIYTLLYNPKTKLFFMINKKNGDTINPSTIQGMFKRSLPKVRNNKNLIIIGDIEKKAVIKITKEVCNEASVQS